MTGCCGSEHKGGPGSYESVCWGRNAPLRFFTEVPDFHNGVYVAEPGYTFADWHRHRNVTWRFRPEPLLMLKVASGYWQLLVINGLVSVAVVFYFWYLVPLGAPGSFVGQLSGLFTIASFALSLLMVFRLNTTYARWWEARTQWGSNLATMRNYTRLLSMWCPPDKSYVLEAARRWVPACFLILKAHVREGGDPIKECGNLLNEKDIAYLSAYANKPLGAAHALSYLAAEAGLHPMLQVQIQEQLNQYVLFLSGNERILRTPIPTGYTRFTGRAILLYVTVMPLLLWSMTGILTPLVSVFVTFIIIGVENVGVQIEEPFRVLHLEALCTALDAAANDLCPWDNDRVAAALDLKGSAASAGVKSVNGAESVGGAKRAEGVNGTGGVEMRPPTIDPSPMHPGAPAAAHAVASSAGIGRAVSAGVHHEAALAQHLQQQQQQQQEPQQKPLQQLQEQQLRKHQEPQPLQQHTAVSIHKMDVVAGQGGAADGALKSDVGDGDASPGSIQPEASSSSESRSSSSALSSSRAGGSCPSLQQLQQLQQQQQQWHGGRACEASPAPKAQQWGQGLGLTHGASSNSVANSNLNGPASLCESGRAASGSIRIELSPFQAELK